MKRVPTLRCAANERKLLMAFLSLAFMVAGPLARAAAGPSQQFLVEGGKAKAVIVLGDNSGLFYRFVGEELQWYIKAITGVTVEIATASRAASRPEGLLVLVGGPTANNLVEEAVNRKQVKFSDLKVDSFVLWRVAVGKKQGLIVGGNDEASTMYAAYDLLERLGVTFLLAKDILPGKTSDLKLPAANVRTETPFPRRGLFISNIYPSRGMMNLSEVKFMLDQMAKLKMNYLQFYWFEHEPWIDFSYHGEHKLLGDATGPESGYLTWRYHYGSYLVKDLPVGRDLFKGRRKIAPAEFQNVETPAEAFQVAKNFLNEIIRYANTRKIMVWLCFDPTTLPGNLARFATRATNSPIPFGPLIGTFMCPADPVLHEINESRLKSLVETYPQAQGYFLWIPEMYPNCPDEQDRKLLERERPKFEGLLKSWKPNAFYEKDPAIVRDSNIGSLHIIEKMIEARDHLAPNAKLGIGGFGRGYALPFMDKRFPKSIPFADMESRAIWTPAGAPLEDFGGMGERERILIPRLDDDSDMFGPQFNLNLYYKDRVFEGSVENGITGFAGQLNRIRGTEQNYLYLAGGAWNPHLTPKEFYTEYSRRVFGERAQKDVMAAFDTLEENEEYLGWLGKFNFICCGVIPEVGTAYGLYMQPNPFDGPEKWEPFITNSKEQVQYFTHSIELLESALANFRQAQKTVAPQGRQELEYLENKTESYAMLLKTLIAARKGYITFYEAFQLRKSPADPAFIKRLDESMALFTETRQLGRQTTEKFAQIIDHPSDMGVLYRANLFLVTGLELVEQTMQDIVNYHHGKEYTKLVPWDKIYYGFPQLAVH